MPIGIYNSQSDGLKRTLNETNRLLTLSLEKLSTGYRINRAADDAAGLSISEKFMTKIRGYEQSMRNTQDGSSLLNIAEGALETVSDDLQRIRELTVQAGNDTLGTSERSAINEEINQRLENINSISGSTNFNNIKLLSSETPTELNIQTGPGSSDYMDISDGLGNVSATAIGMPSAGAVNLSTATAASSFLDTIDSALDTVNTKRSSIGAMQNRLDSVMDNLSVTSVNTISANSRIRDTDIATESSKLVRMQMLQQYNVTLMSQSNSMHSTMMMQLLGR